MDIAKEQLSVAPDSLPQAKLRSPGFFRLLPPSSFSKPPPATISNEQLKLALRSEEFEEYKRGTWLQPCSAEQARTEARVSVVSCANKTSVSVAMSVPQQMQPKPISDSAAIVPSSPWQQQTKAERTANKVPLCDKSNSPSSDIKPGGDATRKLDDKPILRNEKTVDTEQSQVNQTQMKRGTKVGKKSHKFLLSSGKQLHTGGEVQDLSGRADKWTTGSLKHDNLYSSAANGLCAIATVKQQWEYEETGKKQFERSLRETQLKKVTKHLEYYNASFTGKRANEVDLKRPSLRSAVAGSSYRSSPPMPPPRAQQKSASAAIGSHGKFLPSMPVSSPVRQEVIPPQTQTTATRCQTQNGTELQSSKMESLGVAPARASIAVVKVSSTKTRPPRTQSPPLPSRSGHVPKLPTPVRTSTLQNGGIPQLTATRALATATTAAAEPRLEPHHSRSVAGQLRGSEPLHDLGEEGLNDLSEEASGSATSAGVSEAMGGGELGTSSSNIVNGGASSVDEKPASSRDEQLECQVDTRNDTAIAKVLQAEEEAKAGLPLAPPSSSSSQDACDRTLALVMQEEYDAEIASHMQHEEREKAGGGSHGYTQRPRYDPSYNEQTDRRNVLPYSPSPRDNNAPYHLRSRETPADRRRTEHGYHDNGWQAGLGIVAASHDPPRAAPGPPRPAPAPPRPAPGQRYRARRERGGDGSGPEDVNMSYESLLELQDIPRGLDMAAIGRLSTISLYNPVAKSESEENKKCCICLQDFEKGQQLRSLPCIHSFHRYCIDQWLYQNRMCPVCQKDVQEMVL